MNSFKIPYTLPFKAATNYNKKVAYFSMEFAIDQPLKIYSGGLGFLAGSHMRSAYELKQNLIGIGILWKYGYYDQVRRGDKSMDVLFQEKLYSFLQDTGITFDIVINHHPVKVKAYYLAPEVFNSAPLFLLSTDLPENDYLAQTISHRLYDSNLATRIAQYILLGQGGARLLENINWVPDVYHMNEAHALSAAFYLYDKFDKNAAEVKKRLVFTTHTPEKAGNEEHEFSLLYKMGFFNGINEEEARRFSQSDGHVFSHSLVALRLAKRANAVSKKHGEVSREMWKGNKKICPIIHITNSQNKKYWADQELYNLMEKGDLEGLRARKREMKSRLFEVVADQAGKLFDKEVLTIVWARRFAAYKRADLITDNDERFLDLIHNKERPVQIIWAGKPYPQDYDAVGIFNNLVHFNKQFKNSTILVGYELLLSHLCKMGADVWLNNPRVPREASGTSGMTAAMNGAINLSTQDGWMLEFGKHQENSYLIPLADQALPIHEQDRLDRENMLDILENEVIPTYYDQPDQWSKLVSNSMTQVLDYFESARMADEYYEKMFKR
jgi:glycogen phosphorylase